MREIKFRFWDKTGLPGPLYGTPPMSPTFTLAELCTAMSGILANVNGGVVAINDLQAASNFVILHGFPELRWLAAERAPDEHNH